MKRFSKGLSLLFVMVMLLSIFSACGEKPSAGSESQSSASEQQQTDNGTTVATSVPYKELKGEITTWQWSDTSEVIKLFNEKYPNIKVNWVNISAADVISKLQTNVAAGLDVGDIVALEMRVRGKILSAGLLEDLEAPPYNLDRNVLLDWLIPLCTDANDKVCGIEVGPAPASMAFRRPMAMQYFGTEDPTELAKLLSDWDTVIAKGKEMKEKSGGKAYMFANIDEVSDVLFNQNAKPLVENGKLMLSDALGESFGILQNMYEAGIISNQEGPAWVAALTKDEYLLYSCATWGPDWKFKAYAQGEEGKWGLLPVPPGGRLFNSGGTLMAIPKAAKNKELAWVFMEWLRLTEEGTMIGTKYGDLSSIKSLYAKPEVFSLPNPYFGGQDCLKTFAENINNIVARKVTQYDYVINTDAIVLAKKAIMSGKTAEEAINIAENEIIQKYPELKK